MRPGFTRRAALGVTVLGVAGAARSFTRSRSASSLRALGDDAALERDTAVERVLMATVWRVLLPRGSPARGVSEAERALDEVARLEDLLSEFRPTSELARVNAAAGVDSVVVGHDTWTVVERSIDWARRTDGAFDPTWATLRSLWDFRRRDPSPPTPAQVRERLSLVAWTAVELDPHARSIRLHRRGMALGLGGIGKGYALDRARVVLEGAGLRDFLLYAGGQVLASGTRDGRPWRVGVQHPRATQSLLAAASMAAGSLSTGGDYEHFFVHGGRRYHHLLDPRTGYPVEHTVSLTVLDRTGMDADALESALFVMAPQRAMQMARELGVAVLRMGPSLVPELSPAMRGVLELRAPPADLG